MNAPWSLRVEGFNTVEEMERLQETIENLKLVSKDVVSRYFRTRPFFFLSGICYNIPAARVPMKFFTYAITEYASGFFEASIFYSALAVELMLLRTAIFRIGEPALAEQSRKRRLTFRWLIHQAGIVNKTTKDLALASELMTMRDCYVHFQNHLLFSELGQKADPARFPDVPKEDVEDANQIMLNMKKEFDEWFPTPRSLMSKRHLSFIRSRRRLIHKKGIRGIVEAAKEGKDVISAVPNSQENDALDALKWAKTLLMNPAYHEFRSPEMMQRFKTAVGRSS